MVKDATREYQHRLEDLAATVGDILNDNVSFCAACRKHGIDPTMAWNLFKSVSFRNIRTGGLELPLLDFDDCGVGYERLYADVFDVPANKISNFSLPPDAEETVDYVLENLKASDRYKDVIVRYYGLNGHDEQTFSEIGKVYGVTLERIRQIRGRMVRMLRYPSRMKLLQMGLAKYKAIDEAKAEVDAQAQEAFQQELARLKAEATKTAIETARREARIEQFDMTEEDSIEVLDLSVRSYNCLKRVGITTIGALMDLDEDALYHIRNLGRKSIDEIKSKIMLIKAQTNFNVSGENSLTSNDVSTLSRG